MTLSYNYLIFEAKIVMLNLTSVQVTIENPVKLLTTSQKVLKVKRELIQGKDNNSCLVNLPFCFRKSKMRCKGSTLINRFNMLRNRRVAFINLRFLFSMIESIIRSIIRKNRQFKARTR